MFKFDEAFVTRPFLRNGCLSPRVCAGFIGACAMPPPLRTGQKSGAASAEEPVERNKIRACEIELAEQTGRINAFSHKAVQIGPHLVRPRNWRSDR
jgi:hypothetical protein